MADTHKTKAEILQELESIKGLLLEEEDIPILQEELPLPASAAGVSPHSSHPSILPGQGSLFDDAQAATHNQALPAADKPAPGHTTTPTASPTANHPTSQAAAHATAQAANPPTTSPTMHNPAQPFNPGLTQGNRPVLSKAQGENPFLPQHIRERLHGNNPPPLFEYETAKKIVSATKSLQQAGGISRQQLINEVVAQLQPEIERALRQQLAKLSPEDLHKLWLPDH